jgi:NAD(P)-dependent dehydrogenase (short-subunit alcohol dehydrogenase family)/acyl carrier protein
LAGRVKAKLCLLSRQGLPPRSEWDQRPEKTEGAEATSLHRKIEKIRALEALGAEVMTLSADVCDASALKKAFAQVEKRFGALHGIIHAAGVVQGASFRMLAESTPEGFAEQFQAKGAGVQALAAAVEGRKLDFCLIVSSLATFLGGREFAAYVAANAYMDAFVLAANRRQTTPWLTVNWDAWNFDESAGVTEERLQAMTSAEGAEAFLRIISRTDTVQTVVSVVDLPTRVKRLWTKHAVKAPLPSRENTAGSPSLTPLQTTIAQIWKEILGVPNVSADDDFFELGGHSLSATQVVSRLRQATGMELPLRLLFDQPTPAGLAESIEALRRGNPSAGASSAERVDLSL